MTEIGRRRFVRGHNLAPREQTVDLGGIRVVDVSATLTGRVTLPAFASRVVEKG